MVFGRLFDGGVRRRRAAVESVYGDVVTLARDPWLYSHGGVPDTFDGRFEMMVWHLAFVVRRLREEGEEAKAFSQQLFDRFLDDMDKAMREAGVGDIAVPKRLKKMVRVWFGRIRALEGLDAETAGAGDIATVLRRNLYPETEDPPELLPLATHLLDLWRRAEAVAPARVLSGASPYGSPHVARKEAS